MSFVSAVKNLRGQGSDDGKPWLTCRRAGKIKLRPDQPRSDALVFGKRGVCAIDSGARGGTISVIQKEYCAGLGVAAPFDGNDHAIVHAGLRAERSFHVLGLYVETGGRDDPLFLSAPETQIAFGLQVAKNACVLPALLVRGPNRPLPPRNPRKPL